MELHHDEQILYSESPSWRSQFGSHALVLVVAILIGAVVLLVLDPDWIGIVAGIVIALLGTGWLYMERVRTKYIITTHRLHVREGFLSKQVQETRLRRIQNVTINQSVPQRILRVGTVDYDTAGDDQGGRFRMEGVSNPDALIRLVDKAQRAVFDSEREQAARAEAEADAEVRSRYDRRTESESTGPNDRA
ncbi:MAG: PH domain-containing protein [Patulibacter sp.]|nr:PH domain-containing protein [Patulibacter sp.]